MNTWLGDGVENSFFTAANWSLNRLPNSSDEVVFDGDVSHEPCFDFGQTVEEEIGTGDGSYYRISLQDGYTGTVLLGSHISIHNFEMTTGEMELDLHVTGITVIDSFEWAGGGALNDSEVAGGLYLANGCVANIAPGEGVTLTTGLSFLLQDALSLAGGAMATFTEGTLGFKNSAGIGVGQFCAVEVIALAGGGSVTMDNVDRIPSAF